MNRWTRTIVALSAGALAASTALGAAPATAGHGYGIQKTCSYAYGSSAASPDISCVRFANNNSHAVAFAGLGNQYPGIDTGAVAAMRDIITGITDVDAYLTTTDPNPDVVVMDNYYGDLGPIGWNDCPANNTGRGFYAPKDGYAGGEFCRGQYVRFNGNRQNNGNSQKSLACHELGHTFALRHYATVAEDQSNVSCMRSATFPLPETYLAGDLTRVNGAY